MMLVQLASMIDACCGVTAFDAACTAQAELSAKAAVTKIILRSMTSSPGKPCIDIVAALNMSQARNENSLINQ